MHSKNVADEIGRVALTKSSSPCDDAGGFDLEAGTVAEADEPWLLNASTAEGLARILAIRSDLFDLAGTVTDAF